MSTHALRLARPRMVALIALALAVGLSPAPSADAVDDPDSTAVAAPADLAADQEVVTDVQGRRLAVGDSLMVGAAPRMRRRGFAVNARVGRQFSEAPDILRSYGSQLPTNVVIELGTNGTVQMSDCRASVRIAGRHRRVFLVTNRVPRSWQDSNNRTLRACDRKFRRGRVRIIDWYRASADHPGWFAADRVHLTTRGTRAFVRLIDGAVDRFGR